MSRSKACSLSGEDLGFEPAPEDVCVLVTG